MLKHLFSHLKTAHLEALQSQKGQSLIIFTFALLGLIGMLGLALDLGLVYVEQVKIGRTVDAATLAGVVELPFEEDAMRRTIEFIELNGYRPGVDTEIVVRGCVDTLANPYGAGNVSELGANSAITTTNIVTGAILTQYVTADEPRATFMIDTLSYQPEANGCNPGSAQYGNANKLRVLGKVNVNMNFMQFFGFREVPVQDVAVAENITNLDVVVVFDVSGSMEFETTCFDCWVRTDSNNPDWPNNGYFNPLPYNTAWNGAEPSPQSSIPLSDLCVQPSTAHLNSGNRYLVHEAELYSREVGDWSLGARTQGQGFWVLQRGAQNQNNINNPYEDGHYEGNQAGNQSVQSSNVCNPAIQGNGINCSPRRTDGSTPDNVCSSADGGIAADCSAYIKAHPYVVYTQGSSGKLQGASYDITCFSNASDPRCWKLNSLSDPTRPTQSLVPYVEYDFTPDWSGTVNIWIRARGGQDDYARQWNGLSPTSASVHYNTVMWQVGTAGTVQQNTSASESGTPQHDNRIVPGNWQWIKLGSVSGSSGVQQVLRIYQGSAGYKIDKIVFTNASDGNASSYLSSANSGKGPGATNGSATREACNKCNPEFGLTVAPTDCNCKRNNTDAAAGGYGGGDGCTVVITTTNQLEDDLYRGAEPLRSAQEAVKNFAKRLDPQFDQVGLVAFSTNVENGVSGYERRSSLECLRSATVSGDPRECYDPTFTTDPISFTNVLEAVERQWSNGSTDIAEGLREGLVELGVEPYATDSNCDGSAGSACDRSGAARKVLILMTDGAPNQNPGSCAPGSGRPDLWNGDVSPNDDAFECSTFFAREAAEAGVIVYTIGIGAGAEPDLLTAIAEGIDPHSTSGAGPEILFDARGGRFFNAAKPTDLDAIFTQILGNIYVRIVG